MKKVKIYLRKQTKKSQEGYVYINFYLQREKVHFSTRVSVLEKDWDSVKGVVRYSDAQAEDKNLIISKIIARCTDVIVKYRLKNKVLTRKGFFRNFNSTTDDADFYTYYMERMRINARSLELQTIKNHKTLLKKLKTFKEYVEFEDITLDFLVDFYTYLIKECKNNHNTAYKSMATLRKYVRRAYKDGYLDQYPFDDFPIMRTTANYEYLNEEELALLVGFYKKGQMSVAEYKTLQVFLFMCFSSLHIGDAKAIKIENFNNNSFTYFRMKMRNRKPEPVVVPVSKSLAWIITQIIGYRKSGNVLTEIYSDQYMNRLLNNVIKRIDGINKHITHKAGRHTFATIYLANTNDINSLRNILGHSDIRQTLIYAHVLEKSKQRGIECFDKFI